jgi:hypothetical protein
MFRLVELNPVMAADMNRGSPYLDRYLAAYRKRRAAEAAKARSQTAA